VFASEEYNEFAGSAFNDIFAFFLNGENIALIPGTNIPVSINNINANTNSAFFRNNDPSDLEEPLPFNTEFDGFTVVLAASAFVTPGETQRLKIAIADTSDSILDSAVFIKQGSLSTLPQINDAVIVNQGNNTFLLESPTADTGFVNLQFNITGVNTNQINEIGIFRVDDENGTISGVAPGQEGYGQLALTGPKSRVVFTALPEDMGTSTTRNIRNFNLGDRFAFYMIANGTTDEVLFDDLLDEPPVNTDDFFDPNGDRLQPPPKTANPFIPGATVFFSFPSENADGQQHIKVTGDNNLLTIALEDQLGGNNPDFNDLIFNLQVTSDERLEGVRQQGSVQRELIDLTSLKSDSTLQASFRANSEAAFNNTVGLYKIENAQGTVKDPLTGETFIPEDVGYAQVAMKNKAVSFDRNGNVIEGTTNLQDLINQGGLLSPFLISNGTPSEWSSNNPNNLIFAQKEIAYFPFIAANPDKTEHVVLLADNTFGFEDLPGTNSDFDYDDITLQINFF
jgi:hypothetical protein